MATRATGHEKTDVKPVLVTAALVLLCVLRHVAVSHCKSVLTSGSLPSDSTANRTNSEEQISKRKTPDHSIVQNELMLVTVMEESSPAEQEQATFWVDRTLVAITVTVRNRGRQTCLLLDPFGAKPEPTLSSRRSTVWMVNQPTVGRWRVLQEGEGDYRVRVQGSSTVDMEVTMYDVNDNTGLAVLVHSSPTAGHQIRAIIDVIGTDVIKTIYNMSLMTPEGVEVATHWLRAAGDPRDPQYSSTFTWPTQAVYIRVYGEEEKGTVFERQTSFIISPILIDLRLQGGVSSAVIGPEGSLMVSYQLVNQGPSHSFQLSAETDNDVMTAEVSPALVRLGQQDSMLGAVIVTVPRYSAPTSGLLTVRVWSVSNPDMTQSASLFLTFPHTLPDLDPPTCQTLALTGDCSPQDVTSPTCHLRHWRVQVAVEDDVSGVKKVTFADVTKSDYVYVPPFEKGVTKQPVLTVFRATCCRAIVLLDTSDTAGNERRCRYFQAEISPLPPSSTPSPETRMSTSPPPVSTESAAGHVTFTSPRMGSGSSGSVDHTTEMAPGQWRSSVAVTVNVTPSAIHFNETLARSNAVTRSRGDKKHKGTSSTLKTASIILGSIGGCAGLLIALICLLLFWRHRRLLRQRRHSYDSQDSGGSSSDSNSSHRHHGNSHHHRHGNNCRENSSHHHHPGNVSDNSPRHHGNSSSNSNHGNHSHRHHSNVINNLHRHHGNSSYSYRHYGNSDDSSHRLGNAVERHRHWNDDSLHHHCSNTNDSGHGHHRNGADGGGSSRQSTEEGRRAAMPDVVQGSSPVTEFSTAL